MWGEGKDRRCHALSHFSRSSQLVTTVFSIFYNLSSQNVTQLYIWAFHTDVTKISNQFNQAWICDDIGQLFKNILKHFMKFLNENSQKFSWNVSKTFAYKIWADAEVSDFVTDCFNPHANLCSKCLHWINILNASWVHISSTCWHLKQKGKLKGCFRMELHCLWQCLVKRWVNEGAALYCNIHPFIKMCRSQRAEGTKLGP